MSGTGNGRDPWAGVESGLGWFEGRRSRGLGRLRLRGRRNKELRGMKSIRLRGRKNSCRRGSGSIGLSVVVGWSVGLRLGRTS